MKIMGIGLGDLRTARASPEAMKKIFLFQQVQITSHSNTSLAHHDKWHSKCQ